MVDTDSIYRQILKLKYEENKGDTEIKSMQFPKSPCVVVERTPDDDYPANAVIWRCKTEFLMKSGSTVTQYDSFDVSNSSNVRMIASSARRSLSRKR